MLQVLAGQGSLIAKHGDVPKAPVFFQVADPGNIRAQHLSSVLIALLRQRQAVVGMLHHDLVRSQGAHLVIQALAAPFGAAFDPVERPQVRNHAHLPVGISVRVLIHVRGAEGFLARAHRAGTQVRPTNLVVFLNDPALGNRVLPQFHSVPTDGVLRGHISSLHSCRRRSPQRR